VSETGGKVPVGAAIVAASKALNGAEEQLPLFEPPSFGAENPAIGVVVARAEAERRGPGRPPGALNKSTRDLRQWLLGRGVHPLETLMRWGMHSPHSLAIELGCSKLEAFDRLKAVWAELVPYFVPKLQPTDESGQAVPFLSFVIGGAEGGAGPGVPPWAYLDALRSETAENSHSRKPNGAATDGAATDDNAKRLE
jgi:hypothetical protein